MSLVEADPIKRIVTPVLKSLAVAGEAERAGLDLMLERERRWYAHHRRFETNRHIQDMARHGVLVPVASDENMVPIRRFRSPDPVMREMFPALLLPKAEAARRAVGRLWRHALRGAGIDDPRYRLAAVSFVRSEETQDGLVADAEKFAAPDSRHCQGVAFDLDNSGYFEWDPFFGLRKIWHPDRHTATAFKIGEAIGQDAQTEFSPVPYNQPIMDALKEVLRGLHEDRAINYVPEFADTANECSHIVPNPALTEIDWLHIV